MVRVPLRVDPQNLPLRSAPATIELSVNICITNYFYIGILHINRSKTLRRRKLESIIVVTTIVDTKDNTLSCPPPPNTKYLLDFVRFVRPFVEQVWSVPVLEETRVEHVFYVVKVFHCDAAERVDEENAIFRPVRPRHQTVNSVVPMDLKRHRDRL